MTHLPFPSSCVQKAPDHRNILPLSREHWEMPSLVKRVRLCLRVHLSESFAFRGVELLVVVRFRDKDFPLRTCKLTRCEGVVLGKIDHTGSALKELPLAHVVRSIRQSRRARILVRFLDWKRSFWRWIAQRSVEGSKEEEKKQEVPSSCLLEPEPCSEPWCCSESTCRLIQDTRGQSIAPLFRPKMTPKREFY